MKKLTANRLLENIPIGIVIFYPDSDGYHIEFINEIVQDKYGLDKRTLSHFLAGNFQEFVYPDDIDRVKLLLYKGGVAGGKFTDIVRLRSKKGSYIWTDVRLDSSPDENGRLIFHVAFIDINAQKASTQELEVTYEELLDVIKNTPGGIIVFDTKNDRTPIVSLASAGMYRLLEGSEADIFSAYGTNFYNAVHPDDLSTVIRTIEDSLRNLSKFSITLRLRTLKGTYVLIDALGTVVLSEGRRRIYMAFSNSSEDRKNEELLKHILNIFVRKQYDSIGIIDCKNNSFQMLNTNYYTHLIFPDQSDDYDRDIKNLIDHYVVEEDKKNLWDRVKLSSLRKEMQDRDDLDLFAAMRRPANNSLRYKKFWFSWLEKENELLAFVQSDYTEIHQKEIEHQEMLRSALQAAELANVAKSEFLSRMSHDIRTPLTAIIGFTKMIQHDGDGTAETKRRLENIESSSEFLLSLINDVLEMSRIESGKYSLQQKPFALSTLIDGVASIISAQCETKGLHFYYNLAAEANKCYFGDQLKLQQVLINILGNSVKFTEKGGTITLTVETHASIEDKTLVRFTMTDTGIGIAPEFLPHLFDAFAQENKWDVKHTGSGLGLAICKNIVNLMNGSIHVQSTKGEGTTFIVDVQLDIDKTQAPATAEKISRLSDTAAEHYNFSGNYILLAEDHPMNQEIAKYILENVGFIVDIADNGRIACDMFADSPENHYAAVILDIRMPVMDGLEAARTIRAMQRSDAATMPLIAMSANAFEEDISKSLASGINAHLTKPINPEQLFKTLSEHIQHS